MAFFAVNNGKTGQISAQLVTEASISKVTAFTAKVVSQN
jgi:hypothetical protein